MSFHKSLFLRELFFVMAATNFASPIVVIADEGINLYYAIDKAQSHSQVIDFDGLLTVVNERLSGLGKAFQDGDQIEIRVNEKLDSNDLDMIKRKMTYGDVNFNFFVDSSEKDNRKIIDQALGAPWQKKSDKIDTEWFALSTYSPRLRRDDNLVVRTKESQSQVLAWTLQPQLAGEFLLSASKALDSSGFPVLSMTLNPNGQSILKEQADFLRTQKNQTNLVCGLFVDGKAFGAAVVSESKSKPLDFVGLPEEKIDELLAIVNAGILPYSLREVRKESSN